MLLGAYREPLLTSDALNAVGPCHDALPKAVAARKRRHESALFYALRHFQLSRFQLLKSRRCYHYRLRHREGDYCFAEMHTM